MKKHHLSVLAALTIVGSAVAGDITYQPVKQVFNWSGAAPGRAATTVSIQQFETRLVVTQEHAQCRPMSCVAQLPGRYDAWLGLFSAPERDRPSILSRALLGLSPESAALILQNGFLRRMPTTWQALHLELMNAQNTLYSQGHFFNFMSGVFEVNGLANAIKLGYADANACPAAPSYPCSAPSMKRETRPIGAIQRRVNFEVTGALLLPYELESVALRIGGPGEPVTVINGDFDTRLTNEYRMSYTENRNGDLAISLQFLNRPMRAAPSNLIVMNTLAKVPAGGLQLRVELDPNKIAALLARGGRLEVSHELCRRDLLGGCAEVVVRNETVDISNGAITALYPASALKNKKYHSAVRVRAVGTPYFSSEFSDKEKSNKVDMD